MDQRQSHSQTGGQQALSDRCDEIKSECVAVLTDGATVGDGKWLSAIPEQVILHCANVRELNLAMKPGIRLLGVLGRFINLRTLSLRRCHLRSIPDEVSELTQLEDLHLSGNNFSEGLNPAIGQLLRLRYLNLGSCNLCSVPDSLGCLEELRTLHLCENKLQEYPACLLRLKKLEDLDLSTVCSDKTSFKYLFLHEKSVITRRMPYFPDNCIMLLPMALAFTNLRSLHLHGNPIREPPEAIWKQGVEAIRSYLQALKLGQRLLSADTVNMLGDTGAGKTSLVQSLIAGAPDPTAEADRTRVMQQRPMKIDEVSGHSVNVNDFGGHDIYHSVIELFLPGSGLLLLVFDLTKDVTSIKKWLLTAIAKSREIRIILVGTHIDQLRSESERSTFEEKARDFLETVLNKAREEVRSHRSDIECRQSDRNMPSKLLKLHQLLSNLKMDNIPVVTLSCAKPDEGLLRLRNIVIEKVQRPQAFPALWCRVIDEIFEQTSSGLCLKMSKIQDIAKAHLFGEDRDNALKIILRYLVRTSQIIWSENHWRLRSFIFHLPQKIIDTCKKILHHDDPQSFPELYKGEWEEYEKGILSERLLRHLFSKHTGRSDRSQEPATDLPFEVAVDFLEQFDLLSSSDKNKDGRTYIIPSKLKSEEPQEIGEFKQTAENREKRVTVRLSFIGSVVPLSFFETSLSAMLNRARQWSSATIKPWKSGLIVLYDGVHFLAKLLEGCITLTAFCGHFDAHLWSVLQPMLKCLKEHADMWPGAPPKCTVECPLCIGRVGSEDRQSTVGEIAADLSQLAGLEIQSEESRLRCNVCNAWINRNSCYPAASRDRAALLGASHLTRNDARPSRDWDCMDNKRLCENLRRNYSELVNKLSREEANGAASILFSCGMLLKAELEQVHLEVITPTEAAQTLIGYIGKKDTKEMYCAFLEILQSDLNRDDLVTLLTSPQP